MNLPHDILQIVGALTMASPNDLYDHFPKKPMGEIRQCVRRMMTQNWIRFDCLDDKSGYMLTPKGLQQYEIFRCGNEDFLMGEQALKDWTESAD